MPKRGAIALLLTAGALAFLLSFRTPDTTSAGRPGTVAIASNAPLVAPPNVPTATLRPARGNAGGTGTGGRPAATPLPAATPGQPAAPAGPLHDGTWTGTAVPIRWGNVQVQVTVSGGRIATVTSLDMPYGDRRTQRITDTVEPMLRQEALQVQGANIDMVSGATYTSTAYAESLQSALDQAAGG